MAKSKTIPVIPEKIGPERVLTILKRPDRSLEISALQVANRENGQDEQQQECNPSQYQFALPCQRIGSLTGRREVDHVMSSDMSQKKTGQ